MTRTQSRPNAGAMQTTIFSRVTAEEKEYLGQLAMSQGRTLSWLVRDALIQSGYLEPGT